MQVGVLYVVGPRGMIFGVMGELAEDKGGERENEISKSSSLYALTIRVLSLSVRIFMAPVLLVESSVQEARI